MTTLYGPFLPFGPSWWTWIKTLLWTFDFLFHILVVHECGVDFRCFPWTGRLIWHIVRNVIPVRNANFLWMAAQLIHPLTHFLLVHLPCQRSLPLNRDTNLLSSSDKNMAPISYATKWMITTTNSISFLFSLPINFRWLSWYPSNRTSVGSVYASIFLVLSRRSLDLGNWNRWMAVLMDNNGKNLLDCSFSPFIVGAGLIEMSTYFPHNIIYSLDQLSLIRSSMICSCSTSVLSQALTLREWESWVEPLRIVPLFAKYLIW